MAVGNYRPDPNFVWAREHSTSWCNLKKGHNITFSKLSDRRCHPGRCSSPKRTKNSGESASRKQRTCEENVVREQQFQREHTKKWSSLGSIHDPPWCTSQNKSRPWSCRQGTWSGTRHDWWWSCKYCWVTFRFRDENAVPVINGLFINLLVRLLAIRQCQR